MKKQKKLSPFASPIVMTIISLLIAALAGIYAYFLINNYEAGVSEIYAEEQDGYVQLVLDQINLQPDNTDEEIIENILGSLDTSSNQYWTMSHDEAMVFVKDVLETSRYKSFSEGTYYNTDSSATFVQSLEENVVSHDFIYIDGVKYIASGTKFIYNGATYQICLLTNAEIMLQNNTYMSTKINLIIMICVILIILVLGMIILSRYATSATRQLAKEVEEKEVLRKDLEQLDNKLAQKDLYNSETVVFETSALEGVLDKLDDRNSKPVTIAVVPYDDAKYQALTREGQILLGKNVLRVKLPDNKMALFFVKTPRESAEKHIDSMQSFDIKAEKIAEVVGDMSVKSVYEDMI